MKNLPAKKKFGSANGTASGRNDWHTAFFEALQMELREYQNVLEFYYQHQLTSEPLRIDCVVIKKTKDVEIKKNIAAIFREWNIFEYKNPGDYVSIDDFYKVYAYACLYISLMKKVSIRDLTVSFVQSRYPRKLLKHLQDERGYTIAENTEGIYTIKGDILPMQIIDSRKLPAAENLWLKSLRDQLNSAEIMQISEEMSRQKKDTQIAAYLNVITEANNESIQEAAEMGRRKKLTFQQVCENVGLNVEWEARGEARGRSTGKAEGRAEGKLEIARKMKQAERPFSEIAEFTGLTQKAIQKL